MAEIWKDIPGYEGSYQASTLGRIKSLSRVVVHPRGKTRLKGRILKSAKNSSGYLCVVLCLEGQRKPRPIHHLILETFVGLRPEGMVTRHGPKGQLNNSLENLCYGTRSENAQDRERDGTDGNKIVYCSNGRKFNSVAEAAKITKCAASSISNCCRGERKTVRGYSWSYEKT